MLERLLHYWPQISGIAVGATALWTRFDLLRLAYRAILDRAGLARDTHDLRKRLAQVAEAADFWEHRCDDLEKQFRTSLAELGNIRRALREYKQLIHDLLIDREAALQWGHLLAHDLVQHGLALPAPEPQMRTLDLNIVNPTEEGEP